MRQIKAIKSIQLSSMAFENSPEIILLKQDFQKHKITIACIKSFKVKAHACLILQWCVSFSAFSACQCLHGHAWLEASKSQGESKFTLRPGSETIKNGVNIVSQNAKCANLCLD